MVSLLALNHVNGSNHRRIVFKFKWAYCEVRNTAYQSVKIRRFNEINHIKKAISKPNRKTILSSRRIVVPVPRSLVANLSNYRGKSFDATPAFVHRFARDYGGQAVLSACRTEEMILAIILSISSKVLRLIIFNLVDYKYLQSPKPSACGWQNCLNKGYGKQKSCKRKKDKDR